MARRASGCAQARPQMSSGAIGQDVEETEISGHNKQD
jgi:hypothetical protein